MSPKLTTGLTGLKVVENPAHRLNILYNQILKTLAKAPDTAAYRIYAEQEVKRRLKVVLLAKSVDEIEKNVGVGQAEELIVQAENELYLARKMLQWKPWEPLETPIPKNQWKWPPV